MSAGRQVQEQVLLRRAAELLERTGLTILCEVPTVISRYLSIMQRTEIRRLQVCRVHITRLGHPAQF